jgi:hypothetical protein
VIRTRFAWAQQQRWSGRPWQECNPSSQMWKGVVIGPRQIAHRIVKGLNWLREITANEREGDLPPRGTNGVASHCQSGGMSSVKRRTSWLQSVGRKGWGQR